MDAINNKVSFWIGVFFGVFVVVILVILFTNALVGVFCVDWGYSTGKTSSQTLVCTMSCDDGRTITVPFEIIPQTVPDSLCK